MMLPPTAKEASITIIQFLISQIKSADEEFAQKAIESLLRKLETKPKELDSFITAISGSGTYPSKCVTTQRTLDNRLQVAGRKGLPHVIYAQIFRWPDVQKNELRPINSCLYAFSRNCDLVCINPFHYERVLTTVDIATLTINEENLSTSDDHFFNSEMSQNLESVPNYENAGTLLNIACPSEISVITHPTFCQFEENASSFSQDRTNFQETSSSQPSECTTDSFVPYSNEHRINSEMINQRTSFRESEYYADESENTFPFVQTINSDSINQDPKTQFYVNDTFERHEIASFDLETFGETVNNISEDSTNIALGMQPLLPAQQIVEDQHNIDNSELIFLSEFSLREGYWCSIDYFELNTQIGETFNVSLNYPQITIDGFVDPYSGNRFCLGRLLNVNRIELSERTLMHIGKGICLELKCNGDVLLNCLLHESSVFVCSYFLDRENESFKKTVRKVLPTESIAVFDMNRCCKELKSRTKMLKVNRSSGCKDVPIALSSTSDYSIDNLRKMCTLQVSFIKGWGENYHRKSIRETPCWIEVHFHHALQMLDKLLVSVEIPSFD